MPKISKKFKKDFYEAKRRGVFKKGVTLRRWHKCVYPLKYRKR